MVIKNTTYPNKMHRFPLIAFFFFFNRLRVSAWQQYLARLIPFILNLSLVYSLFIEWQAAGISFSDKGPLSDLR